MTPPPAISVAAEGPVGSNYKSDPSFYAPLDFKTQNGVDSVQDSIKCALRNLSDLDL
jgi:hypothetical protein